MIELLFINSLLCLGFFQACNYSLAEYKEYPEQIGGNINTKEGIEDKNALWFVAYYLRNSSQYIQKPLFYCLTCMASIHSYPYWIMNDFTLHNLYYYPVYILALSGLNFILDQITNKLSEEE